MPAEEPDINPHSEEGDEVDSLFGSPPPSPGGVRGIDRSPSPLALPSGTSAQNVGTLALPGSHLYSELPSAHKPAPAVIATVQQQPQRRQPVAGRPSQPVVEASRSVATSRSTSTSRVTTPGPRPTTATSTKTTRKSTRKSRTTATPRPTPPPISLPDPSEPPPSNWLRNQQALLGLAGLVSGVKPANLSLNNTRGSTPSNPIVVEDEIETPKIGRHPPTAAGGPSVKLPAPSSDSILQTLINQKNIFPVIEALLRLSSRGSQNQPAYPPQPPQYSAFFRPPGAAANVPPPLKKRKLSSVPAGAADWDVPYPFPEGQGPADYRTNWERQRGRQLLADLVQLVKSAAKKAAAKDYYQSLTRQQQQMLWEQKQKYGYGRHQEPKVFGHYRPETLHYGLPPGQYAGTPQPQPPMASLVDPGKVIPPGLTSPSMQGHPSTMPAPSSLPYPPSQNVPTQPDTAAVTTATSTQPQTPSENVPPITSSPRNEPSASDLDDFLALFSNMPQSDLEEIFSMPALDMDFRFGGEGMKDVAIGATSVGEQNQVKTAGGAAPKVDRQSILGPSRPEPDATSTWTEEQAAAIDRALGMDPTLLSIDPVLVALSVPPTSIPQLGLSVASTSQFQTQSQVGQGQPPQITVQTAEESSALSTISNTGAPPTPTLIGSPLSARAFSEPDHGPQTPSWEALFGDGEVEIATGDGEGEREVDERPEKEKSGIDSLDVAEVDKGNAKGKGKGKEVLREATPADQELQRSVVPVQEIDLRTHRRTGTQAYETSTQPQFLPPQMAPSPAYPPLEVAPSVPGPSYPVNPIPPLFTAPPTAPPAAPYAQYTQYGSIPTFSSRPAKARNKEDIIKNARAMRTKLVEEIERAKVELWETTMEAGCLALLAKDKGLAGATSVDARNVGAGTREGAT